MDKGVLGQYMDACALIKETERDIRSLERKKKTVLSDSVGGSNPEFPYERRTFRIEGTAMAYPDDARLRRDYEILDRQRQRAEALKAEVEEWMLGLPMRTQRIVRMRVFRKKTWAQVAHSLGGKSTPDGVRKEFERIFEKK